MLSGPMYCVSLHRLSTLQGNQGCYPLAVYGAIDTFSRKVLFLRIAESHKDPEILGRYWFDYLFEQRKCPRFIRADLGSETDVICGIHEAVKELLISAGGDPEFDIGGELMPESSNFASDDTRIISSGGGDRPSRARSWAFSRRNRSSSV